MVFPLRIQKVVIYSGLCLLKKRQQDKDRGVLYEELSD